MAKNFEDVFEQLVPAGRGRLIIQRRIDQDEDADEDAETQQSSVDNYTGVGIKVNNGCIRKAGFFLCLNVFRCPSTPRSMKVCVFSSCPEVRNHWLHWLQVIFHT